MEHNLGDSLNLGSAMENMDFDHSDVVVNQADIELEPDPHDEQIPMEFENNKDEQMLMETENEEVIVSDFISDPFEFQAYCTQNDSTQEILQAVEGNTLNVLNPKATQMLDFQYKADSVQLVQPKNKQKKIIIKAGNISTRNTPLKPISIAPKPSKATFVSTAKSGVQKQYPIAPKPATKPVSLVSKGSVVKVSLANVVQGNVKPSNVIAQLGSKLVMLPAKGGQKIKLLPSSSGATLQYMMTNSDQPQLLTNRPGQQTSNKPLVKKIVIPGSAYTDVTNQSAVLSKLTAVNSATMTSSTVTQPRYVMQQKTVPISIEGNKVILTSPAKQGNVKCGKKQIVAIKSPTVSMHGNMTTKKVVITSNTNHGMVLKTTTTSSKSMGSKEGRLLTTSGQKSQLHQINVPGKGIQYIRLLTNNSPSKSAGGKAVTSSTVAVPSKGFVLTDSKGNVIQMDAEKVLSQPPPLVIASGGNCAKVITKPHKKFVRITPVSSVNSLNALPARSSQSLLAPLSPPEMVSLEELGNLLERTNATREEVTVEADQMVAAEEEAPEIEEQKTLPGDNSDVEHNFDGSMDVPEVEVSCTTNRSESPFEDDDEKQDHNDDEDNRPRGDPVIVIPSNYINMNIPEKTLFFTDNESGENTSAVLRENKRSTVTPVMKVEAEVVPYLSPKDGISDNETLRASELELGARARKACNCTKSQCLKLYCDCFANGEFCNQCNCNNCHNNLEHEEQRQKAIRSCLDRNPHAFRPKIGKLKASGPELVRKHTKGCNCKRSGCLKNYCECFEAKIACTATCKCLGCRNVDSGDGRSRLARDGDDTVFRPTSSPDYKLPCAFMTADVVDAVCQCLMAAAQGEQHAQPDPLRNIIEEFGCCMQDIISAAQNGPALIVAHES